jgi:transcriptional regulator with XRE-family HTH domain
LADSQPHTGIREHQVAKRIRQWRLERGLSVERLAGLAGLTKGYISRIENSPKPPPLYTLSKISLALSVDISTLLSEESSLLPAEITVSRNREHVATNGRGGTSYKYVYQALAPNKLGKNFEPYIVEVSKERRADFRHEGEEFLYVLEGTMEFVFKDATYILEQGDCVFFDSAFAHGGRSIGDKPTRILIVIYSYKRL